MAVGISRKWCYGLRAVFELVVSPPHEPVAVPKIASVKDAPARFFAVVLSELWGTGGKHFCGDTALECLWGETNASIAGVCHDRTLGDFVAGGKRNERLPSPDHAI